MRPERVCSASREPRMSAITSSSRSSALTRPRRMWACSWARCRRNCVRRTMTSTWCLIQYEMNWSSRSVRGTSSTSASMLQPKESCRPVCLYRLFMTTRGCASRLSTNTRRCPVRAEVSSRMSAMPLSLPALTSSAILIARLSGLHMYGSSVTTSSVRPRLSSSMSMTARMTTEPRPVRYASSMPLRPTMRPPVGKSGPLTRAMQASSRSGCDASGFSSDHCTADATSRRLCVGMFVAMPTAMPVEPLTSRFGNRAGRTTGSCSRLS